MHNFKSNKVIKGLCEKVENSNLGCKAPKDSGSKKALQYYSFNNSWKSSTQIMLEIKPQSHVDFA